jgi:L-iditol 2-dehydrogenase
LTHFADSRKFEAHLYESAEASRKDTQMKAVLLRPKEEGGGNRADVVEVEVPALGRGEILVRMKACGLCGTDLEKIRGNYTASMPVLGHEAAGVVSSVGEGVKGLKEGDRVFPHHHVSCGECYYCRRGSETMCNSYRASNLDPGGFSEYFRVPSRNVERGGVLKLPGAVDFEAAALIEPVACCIRALEKSGVSRGDSVLVAGAGPVGMMHALLLSRMGAGVMMSEVSPNRIEFAQRSGLGAVFHSAKENVPEAVKRSTNGRGADLAVVASGSPVALAQSLASVRRGGKVCLFGLPLKGSSPPYEAYDVFNSEVSLLTSYGASELETGKALNLMARREVDFRALITHRYPLEDFAKGLGASVEAAGMKVMITS